MMIDPNILPWATGILAKSPSDRLYFRRHPHRLFRVRRASVEQADALRLLTGFRPTASSRVFAGVYRQNRETVSRYFVAPATAETDLSEAAAGVVVRWLLDQAETADAMRAMGCEGVR